MPRPKAELLVFALTFATAQAVAEEALDPGPDLPSRYGYLVVDSIVGRVATNWQLGDVLTIENLPLGRNTRLVRLPAGTYQWQGIDVPYYDLPHQIDVSQDRRWSVVIEKQKINYAGTLIVHETRGSGQ